MSEKIDNGADPAFLALSGQVLALPDDRFLAALRLLTPITDSPEALTLLDLARSRMRELRPPRPPMLKRQFCLPFETLLHSGESGRPGRIARASIEPVWRFITAQRPLEFARLRSDIGLLKTRDPSPLFDLSVRLWNVAGTVLEQPWPNAPRDTPLLRLALQSAASIEGIKALLPSAVVPDFDPPTVDLIVETMAQLKKTGKALDAYLLVVANKLDNPVKLLSIMDKRAVPVPGSIASQIDSIVVDGLIARSDWFCENADRLDAQQVAREAERLVTDFRLTRDGVSRQARAFLDEQTTKLSPKMREAIQKTVLEGVGPVVSGALDAKLSTVDRAEAELRMSALHSIRHAAKDFGLQVNFDLCLARLHTEIEAQINLSMVRLVRANSLAATDETAQADFFRAIRVLEMVEGSKAVTPAFDKMLSLTHKA